MCQTWAGYLKDKRLKKGLLKRFAQMAGLIIRMLTTVVISNEEQWAVRTRENSVGQMSAKIRKKMQDGRTSGRERAWFSSLLCLESSWGGVVGGRWWIKRLYQRSVVDEKEQWEVMWFSVVYTHWKLAQSGDPHCCIRMRAKEQHQSCYQSEILSCSYTYCTTHTTKYKTISTAFIFLL